MDVEKNIGIILKSIPYQDHNQIVSVFTGERGMVRLFVRKNRRTPQAISTPLVLAELLYRTKSSGLHTLHEGHIIDPFSQIRSTYGRLEAAGKMGQSILKTLWPGKPAPHLFALFLHYLKALEDADHPGALLVSFWCKLLKHEGSWIAPIVCAACQKELEEGVLVGGEAFCPPCAPEEGIFLKKEEREQLVLLTDSRKLEEVGREIRPQLVTKASYLFEEIG